MKIITKKVLYAATVLAISSLTTSFSGSEITQEPSLSQGQRYLELSDRRELFIDYYLIDTLHNVRIVMHHPVDEGVAFKLDKPWEGAFCTYTTIIKDNDIYRAYYRGVPIAGYAGNEHEVTCYAQSKDGIQWEKPNLRLYEINGSFDNNVVLAHAAPVSHNFSPFLDDNPNVSPDQRYKALGGVVSTGLKAYISQDGIHWQKLQEESVINGVTQIGSMTVHNVFDSQNVAFWSESEQCYLCYFRIYPGVRTVARTTSTDFIHWTNPVAMTFGNTPIDELYTNQTAPYFRAPHIYISIPGRFMPDRQVLSDEQAKEWGVDPGYYKDCSDAVLMSSRGGNVYDRTFMEAFIRPGIGMDNWVSRSNYPALNVVQTGPAEMSVYVNQDYAQSTAHLRRYSLRLDGFASLAADYKGGEALTKYFTFSGSELEINYSTSAAGEIKIEIQDTNGKPVAGFTFDDSQTIIGNEIARVVQWKSDKSLKELTGKSVRLRIVMKDADLYSIRFK